MTRDRAALIFGSTALAIIVGATAWSLVTPGGHPDPTPGPTSPSLPRGVETIRVPLDGQLYRCVVYYTNGIDCDWSHPLATPPEEQ